MCSMINYQNRDYNLITNTVNIFRPETTTTYKQKGLSDYIDCSKNNNKLLNPNYRDAYTNNPKVFHKSSGEFTHHHDSCIKLSGFGPFYRALGQSIINRMQLNLRGTGNNNRDSFKFMGYREGVRVQKYLEMQEENKEVQV